MGGGAFYYIGLADLAVQGKDNSFNLQLLPMELIPDLHLLSIETNP
jgi:hypothetical protein